MSPFRRALSLLLPASLGVQWYRSFDCGTGHISDVNEVVTPVPGAWTVASLSGLTPPADASHMLLAVAVVKPGATGTYGANFDDVVVMPTTATLTIPASASIHGAAGTFFQTDVWVMNNSSSRTATVTARHRCFATQTCSSGPKVFDLPPRQSTYSSDVIGTYFGDPESSGAIELTYDPTKAYISALSRTHTPSFPAPTYGTSIPALPSSAAQTRSLFLGLGSNGGDLTSGFRSNAGVVTLEAYLVVTATAPVFAYVTVNDNQSGDQIYLRAADDHPPN